MRFLFRRCMLALLGCVTAFVCLGSARAADVARSNRRPSVLVALGDSVPFGTACNCTPFPVLAAAHLGARAFNDAVPGYTSTDVLTQLDVDATVIAQVSAADVVLVEAGANDIAHSDECGTRTACYAGAFRQARTNLQAIIARITALTAGRHVRIALIDYWNVWLGGAVGAAQGVDYVDAANTLTESFSDMVQSIAASTGATYVDVHHEFRGPDATDDETALLAGDGDHANAEGHERIAEAVERTLAQDG